MVSLKLVHYYHLFRETEIDLREFARGELAIVLPEQVAVVHKDVDEGRQLLEQLSKEFGKKIGQLVIMKRFSPMDTADITPMDVLSADTTPMDIAPIDTSPMDISSTSEASRNPEVKEDVVGPRNQMVQDGKDVNPDSITPDPKVHYYDVERYQLVGPEPQKYKGLKRLTKLFSKEHRRLLSLRFARYGIAKSNGFNLRLIAELVERDMGSIVEYTKGFSSAEELSRHLRRIYISDIETQNPTVGKDIEVLAVAAEDPMDEKALFLKTMKEKPKTFRKYFSRSKHVREIDLKGMVRKLIGKKGNGSKPPKSIAGSKATPANTSVNTPDPKANTPVNATVIPKDNTSANKTVGTKVDTTVDSEDGTSGHSRAEGTGRTGYTNRDKASSAGAESGSNTDNEQVIFATTSMLQLRDFKYRSNLSMRIGKLVVTDRRIVTYRRRFSLFPSLPFFAFVRPNNRIVALFSQIGSRIKIVMPAIKAFLKTFGAVILGFLAVFWQTLSPLIDSIDLPQLPSIPGITVTLSVAFNFALENPTLLATIIGVIGSLGPALYQIFRIAFLRSRAVTVVTPEMVLGLGTVDQFRRGKDKSAALVLRPMGTSKLPRSEFGFKIVPRSNSPVPEAVGLDSMHIALLGMLGVAKWFHKPEEMESPEQVAQIPLNE